MEEGLFMERWEFWAGTLESHLRQLGTGRSDLLDYAIEFSFEHWEVWPRDR